MSKSKYGNKKITYDGIEFDSKKEARRYAELMLLKHGGIITDIKTQVVYELIPSQKIDGKTAVGVKYIADFVYYDLEKQQQVVEDVKGYKAGAAYQIFTIKKKLMKFIHNIDVREV